MENISVDDFEVENQESVQEAFVVDSDSKADWAMRKLRSIRKKQAENKAIFDAEIKRLAEWLDLVNTALERDALWFESNLTPYALLQRSEGRKSIVLPHGTIKTTAGRAKIELENEDEFKAWAEKNLPEVLRHKIEIDKKELNALLTEDNQVISTQGEIIPLVKVVPAQTSVSFVIE